MYTYRANVRKIVDGDTIDVDVELGFDVVLSNQRVRLYGIATPESRTRNLEEKFRGLLSKSYLQEQCPKGSYILLESKDRGKFGRILGILYHLDNKEISINDQMIQEGYAVPYTGGNKAELEALHLANKQILISRGLIEA